MIESQHKYNFPAGNPGPFEPEDMSGNYFVFANAPSNLGRSLDDFRFDVLAANIDMGYKSISICRRLVLISKGKTVGRWPDETDENHRQYLVIVSKPYNIYVKGWRRMHPTMNIYNSTDADEYPWAKQWKDLDASVRAGIQYSGKTGTEVVIAAVLDSINWH